MPSVASALPISIFDSGVGGLTVLQECLVFLPHEDFVYLGDTARFPYGDRPAEQLRAFSLELGERLVDAGSKLVVVACNSATAAALGELRRRLCGRVGVIGVVGPESRLAAEATRNGRVGLLATPATVASGAYERALGEHAPSARLHAVPCPDLAPLIQAGPDVDDLLVDTVDRYCAPLRQAGVDTVVLGCTHYPIVTPVLRRALGPAVQVIGSGAGVAAEVDRVLTERGLRNEQRRRGTYRFLCSGDAGAFRRLGTRFLQLPLRDVQRIDVTVAEPPAGAVARAVA